MAEHLEETANMQLDKIQTASYWKRGKNARERK